MPAAPPQGCRTFAVTYIGIIATSIIALVLQIIFAHREPVWVPHVCEILLPVHVKERLGCVGDCSGTRRSKTYLAFVPVRVDDGRQLVAHRLPNGAHTFSKETVDAFADRVSSGESCKDAVSATTKCMACLTNPAFTDAPSSCLSSDSPFQDPRCLNRVFLGTQTELDAYLGGNLATYYTLLGLLLLVFLPIGACVGVCAFPETFRPLIDQLVQGRRSAPRDEEGATMH